MVRELSSTFVRLVGFLTLCCVLGCQNAPVSEQTPRPHREVEQRLVAQMPSLESVLIGRVSFLEPVRVSTKMKAGHILTRDEVLRCVDLLAVELKIPAENVALVDQWGNDHSSRLVRAKGEVLRHGQFFELILAKKVNLAGRAREILEIAFPGRTRVELSISVDGWRADSREQNWSSRAMFEPHDGPSNPDKSKRKIPNVIGGKLFLAANNLSEKELVAVKGFVQDTTGIIPLEFMIDNRSWRSPIAPVKEEPRVPINTGILVALLGILGALGVIPFWSRKVKR